MPPSLPKLSFDQWVHSESIRFDIASGTSFDAAVDQMLAAMGESVELVGLGEPMHGASDFLILRNRLFQRPASYSDPEEAGFSHCFGRASENRALIEWMREYNADSKHIAKLQFYGFDSPTEMMWTDSPRRVVEFVLDYLASAGSDDVRRRTRIAELLGGDAPWETQEAAFDPTKSIGLSPSAAALRIEVEDLLSELNVRRPELAASTSDTALHEALQYASIARQLLNYHAVIAQPSENRTAHLLGIRDAMMADILAYIVERERSRGRVLAFAHNSHLQRGLASWQWGPNLLEWWPAGAHVSAMLGSRYAAIGVGVGASESQGITAPEPDALEAHLTANSGPARFIPTHRGESVDRQAIATLPVRTGATKNPGYFPFTAKSLSDFDWLAVLDSIT